MSELGRKILAALEEGIAAMESGKPTHELFPESVWRQTDVGCKGCGETTVLRRDWTEPNGLFETTFICQGCGTAFWLEEGDE